MAIDGNSKSFYNSFTSRPEITFSASAKSIMEGFTYSNWYGYGKHEPEKHKYIDENGVQQKEWVQDPTNYFYPAFFMELYPLDLEMTFGIIGGDLTITTPTYPQVEIEHGTMTPSSTFTQARLDAFRYWTGIGQIEDGVAALGAKFVETGVSVVGNVASKVSAKMSANQTNTSAVDNTTPSPPPPPKPVNWRFMVGAAAAGETLKESTEEAGEKAARELLEKAAKDVSDSSEDVIKAAAARQALEGDVRAAQGAVESAESSVDAARQQVAEANRLVNDAQTKVDELVGKMNEESRRAQGLFQQADDATKRAQELSTQADNLEKFRLDYERRGLEVPTWCSPAEITRLRNQAQSALNTSAMFSRQAQSAVDSSAAWSRQATIANQTLLTRQEDLLAYQRLLSNEQLILDFSQNALALKNAEYQNADADYIANLANANQLLRDYEALVTDTGFDSLAQRLEQLDNVFSQGNFNTRRDGTIDWSDPENITEFFNIVDGCTDYLRGIHVYNTVLRDFGRKWVDFCKYDWGERLVEDYGVASNYSDYEED